MEIEANPLRAIERRTPVTLVAGLDPAAVARTAEAMIVAGTTLVHHDLGAVASGRVMRTVRSVDLAGEENEQITEVNLEHGCVSCTLRVDLLPLLRRLHQRSSVESIVVQLDSVLEPEAVAWAIEHVMVTDMPGFVDGPASRDVRVAAVVACVCEAEWLDAATGDLTVGEAGIGDDDDERTLAQVAVGQVGFADALVVAAADPGMRDQWQSARLMAVLRRLAPGAPIATELPQRPIRGLAIAQLLRAIPATSRRGRIDGPHDPLLRDRPPLERDCGVQVVDFAVDRPFHPQRLHETLDVLLDGVVCTRGRLWLANRPDDAFWIESAGQALQVSVGGRWLAAMTEQEQAAQSIERRAMGALRWHHDYGDRHSAVVILTHRADAEALTAALTAACLTDAEMNDGQQRWMTYGDPFGVAHTDPCDDLDIAESGLLVGESRPAPDRRKPDATHPGDGEPHDPYDPNQRDPR